MKTFIVKVKEVYFCSMKIEAENEEQAVKLIREGEGEEERLEYLDTLDVDLWKVKEVEQ